MLQVPGSWQKQRQNSEQNKNSISAICENNESATIRPSAKFFAASQA